MYSSFFNIYFIIYLFCLRRVLVVAHGTFIVACGLLLAACRLLGCGMWTLSCSMHVGSSSPTRDRTRAPCIGSTGSYPLDHQESPTVYSLLLSKSLLCLQFWLCSHSIIILFRKFNMNVVLQSLVHIPVSPTVLIMFLQHFCSLSTRSCSV